MKRSATESKLLSVTFQLSLVHSTALRKPINGQGGWQSLLKGLQERLKPDNTLTLNYAELKKIYQYCYKYGQGGFESRLEGILFSIKDATDGVVEKPAKSKGVKHE